ncbi:MAG TPA: hypothetical protein VHL53_20910 [Acidimicrobiia bacterium]|nr:hypothetical protein [Acidimicrobiia bacterium]
MVAVEQPRADCGHLAALTQQCGKCLRWCCPECYVPWTALACGDCRAEARAAAANPYGVDVQSATIRVRNFVEPPPAGEATAPGRAGEGDVRCRERGPRARGAAGPHRHKDRTDVGKLAARVADLERRLQELGRGT